jgi:ribonuclease R
MARKPDRGQTTSHTRRDDRGRQGRTKDGRAHGGRAHPSGDDAMPSREQILQFLEGAQGKVGKREIARAFGIKGGDKIALKRLLSQMAEEGTLTGDRKALREKGVLPPVTALEIVGRDRDGDLIGEPVIWDAEEGEKPRVRSRASRRMKIACRESAIT